MAQPALVSIVIPAYKSAWFEEALCSALSQDHSNFEVIVSDDCATDEIKDIVEKWQKKTAVPLRYIRNKPALGELLNYEQCIEMAEGKYLKYLFDDDVLAPGCVSALVAAIEKSPAIRIATSRRHRIDVKGERMVDDRANAAPVKADSVLNGNDVIRFQHKGIVNFIGEPSTVLFYREDLLALIAHEDRLCNIDGELMYFLGDLVMYTKILRNSDLAYLVEPLSSFRVSHQQVSQLGRMKDKRAAESHKRFPELLTLKGWGADDTVAPGFARVAPLDDVTAVRVENIEQQLEDGLKQSMFEHWMSVRKLTATQEQLIADHLAGREAAELTLLIDGRQATATAIYSTLASLNSRYFSSLKITPVVITDLELEGVTTLPADSGIVNVMNERAAAAPQAWHLVVLAGTTFTPSGLISLSTTLVEATGLLAVCGDEIFYVNDQPIGARFRPDFSLDMFLSNPAVMGYGWLLRGEIVNQAGKFDVQAGAAFEFDILVRLIENNGFSAIGHLAEPLFITPDRTLAVKEENQILLRHLANRGYPHARLTRDIYGHCHIDYAHAAAPLVSIIIPAGRVLANLITCVTSLIEKTTWSPYELIVVGDGAAPLEMQQWMASLAEIDPQRIKVALTDAVLSRAATINQASTLAQGEYLTILHPDVIISQPDWLSKLLNHALRPEVAIVGGKQLYSDGTVRHAGYVLGLNGVAGEAFFGANNDDKGHMGRLHFDQNYSAVSGDLLVIKRDVFNTLSGVDETIQDFWDVDLCLRARAQGWLTVWTPSATVIRSVASKVALSEKDEAVRQEAIETAEDEMFRRWEPQIASDPAYNTNLSLSSEQFMVCPDSLLSWRPLSWKPLPVVIPHMADYAGCGYYRVIKPFEAMERLAIADGKLSETFLSIPYLKRFQPDSIIFQRQLTPEFHAWAKRVSRIDNTFMVYELDDYLTNLPIKNVHRAEFSVDVIKMLRKSLSYMDRFVVSTAPLAEAFSDLHPDIVVMHNRLPEDWWGGLTSLRQQGKKPRVGWAGGSSHTGDLEMIADVIKAFADEVEWVFFGMCPPKLLPWIHEFHSGIDIEMYPQKLASLNLDLALAPVEDNIFNACKSNLRLMEYGACAIPVICSDVACYQTINSVTRVKNRYKDWVDAIRFHLDNAGASERMGRELYDEIRRDWTLNSDNVTQWAKAWLPG